LRSTATRLRAVRRRSLTMRILSAAHAFIVNALTLAGWSKKVGEGRCRPEGEGDEPYPGTGCNA